MTDALFDSLAFAERLTQRERFVAPLLSVLNATLGDWQGRKAAWLADFPEVAIPLGREGVVGANARSADDPFGAIHNRKGSAVSLFDPVLAEVAYSWWTRPGDVVVDPFAGGPVRGLVAASMERNYVGVDVRQEQVDANESVGVPRVRWLCADAARYSFPPSDFVFSCPPYGSLEVYSDDPRDLSTMEWVDFAAGYAHAIGRSVSALRQDRFAAFVVGNFKERGTLRDLVGLTIDSFGRAGASLYADIVYMAPMGNAAARAESTFPRNRRPMPHHQMLLVFAKGDARRAADRLAS